jgi:hypothetical protein
MKNFFNGITKNENLNAPINEAAISTHLCHLGNIAQFEKKDLIIDPSNGQILDKSVLNKHQKRVYQPGWEPKL